MVKFKATEQTGVLKNLEIAHLVPQTRSNTYAKICKLTLRIPLK